MHRTLIRQEPTGLGSAKPEDHSCWAHGPHPLSPHAREPALHRREATPQRSPPTATGEEPLLTTTTRRARAATKSQQSQKWRHTRICQNHPWVNLKTEKGKRKYKNFAAKVKWNDNTWFIKLKATNGWEDPLKKQMATYFSILAWTIPWTEGPCGLYSPWGLTGRAAGWHSRGKAQCWKASR